MTYLKTLLETIFGQDLVINLFECENTVTQNHVFFEIVFSKSYRVILKIAFFRKEINQNESLQNIGTVKILKNFAA